MANIINYNEKTNWKIDEIFKPDDANRIEKGVKDDNNGLKVLNDEVQALSDLIGSGGSAGTIAKRVTDLETSTTELANSKLDKTTVTDNLTSTSSTSPLSANQGRLLNINVNSRVEKVAGKDLSSNDYTTTEKNKLNGLQNTTVTDSLTSTSTTEALSANQGRILNTNVNSKVDKVTGKGLSTNDYTTVDRNKLATLNNTTVVDNLTSTSSTSALSANQGKILSDKSIYFTTVKNSGTLSLSHTTTDFPLKPTSSSLVTGKLQINQSSLIQNFSFHTQTFEIISASIWCNTPNRLFIFIPYLLNYEANFYAIIGAGGSPDFAKGELTLSLIYRLR